MTGAAEQDNRLLESPRMPRPGQLVAGRYEIDRVIGSGGFGVVYLCKDHRAGGEVALKVLDPHKSERPQFAARFRQEVLMVRNLKHHNTIKVQDVGETENGCLFMAMEYVEGEPLSSLVEASGGLPPGRVVRIAGQILRSLAEAHARHIIHRDLKPSNIMIAQLRGEPDYVKVLDFGVAKALSPELSLAKTQTSELMCTPAFAAPELLNAKEEVGPQADLYALGLIMIEMLKGGPVFTENSLWGIVAQQLSPDPIPIPEAYAETPLGLVIRKAVQKSKADRYVSADEMLSELLALGLYPSDMPTLTGPRATTQSQPNPTRPSGLLAASGPTTPSQAAPASGKLPLLLSVVVMLLAGGAAAAYFALSSHPPDSVGDGGVQPGDAGTTADGGQAAGDLGGGGPGADGLATSDFTEGDVTSRLAACGQGDRGACEGLVALALDTDTQMDREASARDLEIACTAGSASACVPLGALYEAGGTLPHDYGRAFGLYDRACQAAEALGCVRAGRLVATARGAPRDDVRAVELYRQGCDGGVMEGCLNLGAMYFSGQGVRQNHELAHAFFQQACNGGNMQGCAVLGSLYHHGRGFGQDFARARNHYERACSGGEPAGCSGLAQLYEQGLGVDPDPARAVGLYEQACGGESADACSRLGQLYRDGTLVPADAERAVVFFQRACDLGHGASCALATPPEP